MRYVERDPSLEHQVDLRFQTSRGAIHVHCNCRKESLGVVTNVAEVVRAYNAHLPTGSMFRIKP